MKEEIESFVDKICKEELKQEPNETNLAFRKTMVHAIVRWEEYQEQPAQKVDTPFMQNFFNAIIEITGFTPLQSDMFDLLNAIEKDGLLTEQQSDAVPDNIDWDKIMNEYINHPQTTSWNQATLNHLADYLKDRFNLPTRKEKGK